MKKIAPQLYTFTGLVVGRVYLIRDPDGLTLVDTGLALAAERILHQLRAVGRQAGDVKRILITHGHLDHIGGLPQLKRTTGAEVIASALERPVIADGAPVARPPRESLRPMDRLLWQPPSPLPAAPVDRVVGDGDVLPDVFGGLQVVATPGHAPGHLSFWQPEQRILFCGDVLMHLPWGLSLPVPAFTVDMAEDRRSVRHIAGLAPAILCPGHGFPLTRGTAARLRAFAEKVNS